MSDFSNHVEKGAPQIEKPGIGGSTSVSEKDARLSPEAERMLARIDKGGNEEKVLADIAGVKLDILDKRKEVITPRSEELKQGLAYEQIPQEDAAKSLGEETSTSREQLNSTPGVGQL
jgi:hypothetical protein